ncbi:MAG TPA: FecR family protein [Chryseosolibacter sp.]|nr:FecR family protein [Chryseosolibacter sp.]
MDKNFQNLLVRYVKGDCTAEEIEKVNRWYETIADNTLHLEPDEKQAIRTRMLSNIRKSLAEHNRPVRKHRYLFTHTLVKVAAAVILVVVSALWLFTGGDPVAADDLLTEIPELSGVVVFENETDSSRLYNLPDGSTVRLGSSSRLHFNRNFSEGKREVYLTGKGFFDVVKDPSRPFYVYSRTIATWVLGTSFFVDAPENGRKVEVQVITGKVSVFQIRPDRTSEKEQASMQKHSTANGVVLSPNQKVEYYTEEDHWVTGLVEEPVPVKSLDEKTLSFVFENAPINTVLTDVHSRFGIEVLTENERICQCTFTGDVSKMTLYDMLDVISNSIGATYEVKGTRILISGKGCD